MNDEHDEQRSAGAQSAARAERELGREKESERDDDADGDDEGGGLGGRVLSASPLIWILLAAAIGWAVWATLDSDGGGRPSARLVVLPPADQPRTVVALSCQALGNGSGSSGSPSEQPGAVTAVIPPGGGERLVAVTGCRRGGSGAASSFTSSGGGPTQLIVLPAGTQAPSQDAASSRPKVLTGLRVASTTRVRSDDPVETVVIPPCTTTGTTMASGFANQSGGGVIVVGCPSGS